MRFITRQDYGEPMCDWGEIVVLPTTVGLSPECIIPYILCLPLTKLVGKELSFASYKNRPAGLAYIEETQFWFCGSLYSVLFQTKQGLYWLTDLGCLTGQERTLEEILSKVMEI